VCSAAMVRIEELEPVASPNGWTLTATLVKYELTPGGSEKISGKRSYNFKAGPDDESQENKERRLDVKRNARRRAHDMLQNPDKHEKKKQLRRKGAQAAPMAATPSPPLPAPPLLPAAAPCVTPVTECVAAVDEELDRVTERDWALLRAWKEQPTAEAVLCVLRDRGLDDEEEPWTVARVRERHEFLCRCVRVASRLAGVAGCVRKMRTLACLCA
jgi:hypothetical protein